ncbi:hypothetical protein EV363DRAFT_1410679 [Boletus edulis]|nr:hypothetical protein EV363DRAFT_1410679 [Boletus edulis]
MTIDPADKEESQGVIDDPDDMVDDPEGHVGHPLARTRSVDARKVETAPGQTVDLAIYEIGQESSTEGRDIPGHHVDNPGGDTTSIELTAPGGDHTDTTVELASIMGTQMKSGSDPHIHDDAQCEDVRDVSKKLRNASKRIELTESGCEALAWSDTQRVQEGPEDDRNSHYVDANVFIKGVWDREKILEDTEYDGVHPRIDGNERVVKTNALHRVIGPGDPEGKQEVMGHVERDWRCRIHADTIHSNGRRGGNDGATSGTRRDSKRVETDALAAYHAGQHEQRRDTTNNVPGPSIPPPNCHRRSCNHLNHRVGEDDSNHDLEESVWPDGLTKSLDHVEAKSGKSDVMYMLYMDYRRCRRDPRVRYAKTAAPESIESTTHT